jgi:predicted Zn-dependent protease
MTKQYYQHRFWQTSVMVLLLALLMTRPLAPLAHAAEGEDFWTKKNEDNLELRVADIGQRLLERNALDQLMSFHISYRSLGEKSNVNASASPDYGDIFVESGLLRLVRSDDELAGILAHEMGHVLHKDARRQRIKYGMMAVPAVAVLVVASAATGGSVLPLAKVTKVGMQAAARKFSRSQETQADLEGLMLMAKAGYNPDALPVIMKRVLSDGSAINLWRSHPKGTDRLAAMAIALPEARKLYAQNQVQKPAVVVAKAPQAKPSAAAVTPKVPRASTNDDQDIIEAYQIETEGMPTE